MRKVVIHRPGGYERLSVETHPDPRPGPGEVRVAAAACGVNFADCAVRMGLYASAKEYVGWPITPGFELAGTVDALGPDVDDLAPGDRVIAVTRFGGYASSLVVPRHQVFAVPDGWTLPEAAAFPAVHLTAWYGLLDLARPRPGDRVLVHSAAGGVGQALVRLGGIAGLHVVGVVGRPHKVAAVRALGAAAVIDKASEDLWRRAEAEAPGGYDVVLDANGVETLRQGYRHLAPAGRLVVYGFHTMFRRGGGRAGRGAPEWLRLAWGWLRTPRFDPLDMTGANKSVLAFNLSYLFHRTDVLAAAMTELLGWAADGRLPPPQVTELPFADVAGAHRALESGDSVGKIVLRLEDGER